MLQLLASGLPGLKNGKVVGVADEDTPEEPERQESIEGGCAGVLLGVCECGKGHVGDFEWADLQILPWQGRKRTLRAIQTTPDTSDGSWRHILRAVEQEGGVRA